MNEPSHSRTCRVCGTPLHVVFADLGMIPLCQSYVGRDRLFEGETFYPLRATACMRCHYVGLPEYVCAQDIFSEYAYFSSTSTSWLAYVRESVDAMIRRFRLNRASQVIEMASNDGYLLKHFVSHGIPALGVEPAANVARVANERGVPTLPAFFDKATAARLRAQGKAADLLIAFNCLDHVPDVNDVLDGMKLLLKPGGAIQVELPYLRAMVEDNQFDTIYHDRYSYFSLLSLEHVFKQHGLSIFDAARIPTHGGSLRLFACHAGDAAHHPRQPSVARLLNEEVAAGMTRPDYYEGFVRKMCEAKFTLLELLMRLRRQGRSIVGYGVPAKGNVLLNYCGIRSDQLDYLVDRSPYKCGKFAPGTRLEIRDVAEIQATRPDYLLILPWNIKDEIQQQLASIREWGGRFIVPIPHAEIV